MNGGHRHSVVRTSHDVYPSAVRVARYHTACTPEVRVHIGSQASLNTQQSEGYFSNCREMFLNLQPLPVLQFLLKKTNDRQKSRMILGGVGR